VQGAEDRVEKAYDWYFERKKLVVQTVLAFLTAFVVALVAAVVRGDLTLLAATLIALVGVLGTGVLGVQSYWELHALPEYYLEALDTLDALKRA